MIEITKKEWKDIPTDYKGIVTQEIVNVSQCIPPEHLGKRQCFAGCIKKDGGTTLLTEDIDFKII